LIEVIFQKGFMQCITSIGCRNAKNKMVLSGQRSAAHLFEETQASPSRAKKK